MTANEVDVLVVGAGPTGLTLALQLASFGVHARLVDRGLDRVHESRALAIQPRTLEVLAGLGVTDELVAGGNPAVQLRLHAGGRVHAVPMFDLGLHDTAYPHLLFLSQAETERILTEHLTTAGTAVERGVELTDLRDAGDTVTATLRHRDGQTETVSARYVVGCDGALFFFPLGKPATWRLLAMRPPGDLTPPDAAVTLNQVQSLADTYTAATVRLRHPLWMTNFRLQHRAATRYRAGRVFLAGDAAHIHSPAGAQGMNTGIQDAVNLGWKLAHTIHSGVPGLLDTYEPERAPIGRMVLRFTDRAFSIATSTNPLVRFARTRVAPAVLPLALKAKPGRAYAFRTVAELAINYRHSPLSVNGPNHPHRGPKAGDRLPDAPIVHDGQLSTLHQATAAPGWHVLLCGTADAWPAQAVTSLTDQYTDLVGAHHLTRQDAPRALHDPDGTALRRLGLRADDTAQYLIRPDGHIGYRTGSTDLTNLAGYLARWLPTAAGGSR